MRTPGREYPVALKLSLLTTLTLLTILLLINQPLQTDAAPRGIVSFQTAASEDGARAILASWDSQARFWAKASLWLDFAFASAYALTLVLLTNHFSPDRRLGRTYRLPLFVKGSVIGAGLCDATENILLLTSMNSPGDTVNLAATVFATAKFTGLILGLAGLVMLRFTGRQLVR